jgi:membrane carboxypeptidase/penicillin-binding protein
MMCALINHLPSTRVRVSNWLPDNYESRFLGKITLKRAFANSSNSVAVQLSKELGGKKIAKTARLSGITSEIDEHDLTITRIFDILVFIILIITIAVYFSKTSDAKKEKDSDKSIKDMVDFVNYKYPFRLFADRKN